MRYSYLLLALASVSALSSSTVQQTGQSVQQSSRNHRRHKRRHHHKKVKLSAPVIPVVPLPPTCAAASSLTLGPFQHNDNNGFLLYGYPFNNQSFYDCWMARLNDSRTCFMLNPDAASIRARHSPCSQDPSDPNVYICNGDMAAVAANNVSCSLPAPTGDFIIRYILPVTFIAHDNPCTITNGIASCSFMDPLILDMNRNGKVEAARGTGIDLDLDGKPDGAAINGDKMLAMSDLNGNGKIDGNEVFGDRTLSPFTKKPYNAANGFDSLNKLALEAEKHANVKLINGTSVDIIKLAKVLENVGVKLGFVSDGNDHNVETLYGVKNINLKYQRATAAGYIERREIGSYEDAQGNVYAVDDVWFAE